jgi:hypothetical protein
MTLEEVKVYERTYRAKILDYRPYFHPIDDNGIPTGFVEGVYVTKERINDSIDSYGILFSK